jgi:hypothetical protein
MGLKKPIDASKKSTKSYGIYGKRRFPANDKSAGVRPEHPSGSVSYQTIQAAVANPLSI